MKMVLSLITLCFLYACSGGSSTRQTTTQADSLKTTGRSAEASGDTLIVDTRAAVFYSPDSLKIEREEKAEGEDFYTAADDAASYMFQSRQFMDSLKVKSLDAVNQKFIKFIRSDGVATYVRTDTLNDLWGVYLFDPAKVPLKGDIVSIDESYKSYFE